MISHLQKFCTVLFKNIRSNFCSNQKVLFFLQLNVWNKKPLVNSGLTTVITVYNPGATVLIIFVGISCDVSFELLYSAELGGNADVPTLGSAVGCHDGT